MYIKSYTGGGWAGDWLEHYNRARFLLNELPWDYAFLNYYSFTARPPLANAVHAFFMGLGSSDFIHFQVVNVLGNSFVFFPVILIGRSLIQKDSQSGYVWPILLLLMVNPMFMQNMIYPWTRMICTFYVLMSVYFFLRSQEVPDDSRYPLLGFLGLAAGFVAHYSVGPYIVGFVVLYFVARRTKLQTTLFWKQTLIIGALSISTIGIWFLWAISNYGLSGTVATNSVVIDTSQLSIVENLMKMLENIFNTLVPHPLRLNAPGAESLPNDTLFFVRDYFFLIYQVSLIPAMGLVSWAVLLLQKRHFFSSNMRSGFSSRTGWIAWLLIVVVLGIAVHGDLDAYGLAHICLQPIVFLGLVLLASEMVVLSKKAMMLLIAGLACDFLLGIAIHLHLLHIDPKLFVPLLSDPSAVRLIQDEFGIVAFNNFMAQLYMAEPLLGEVVGLHPVVFWSGALLCLTIVGVQILTLRRSCSPVPSRS
jgi:hypothetical protein